MRLSWHELNDIKNKILKDLYGNKKEELHKKSVNIAERNRLIWLNQYKHLLDELPNDMLTRHKEYKLRVTYPWGCNPEKVDHHKRIHEAWECKFNKEEVNPVSDHYYAAEQDLHTDLKAETEELCIDMLALNGEEHEMSQYLSKTTNKFTGSQQLRKVWPKPFHKYLPVEPQRAKRKQPEEDPNLPTIPDGLNERLTTNLLEDS